MLKTTQENKMSASCTRESGLLKKPTEGQLTVSFFSIPHPATNFRYVLCNPWDVNYPASQLSKWTNLAPAAGSIFILYLFIKISFIPHPAFSFYCRSLLSSSIRSNLCWTLETMVCFPPCGLRYSSEFFFIFYATPNPQLVCNSNLELVRTWQIDFNVKWNISWI